MLRSFWQRLTGATPRTCQTVARRSRLGIETLESRWLPSCTSIAGFVYADTNHNGVMDADEHGIANTTIQLHRADGELVATVQTDATGHYLFDNDPTANLAPQEQTVEANFETQTTNWTEEREIAKFDSSKGTLTEVEIFQDATLTSHVKVENAEPRETNASVDVVGSFTLNSTAFEAITGAVTIHNSATLNPTDDVIDYSGPGSHDFGEKSATASSITLLRATEHDLSGFIGSGTVRLSETAEVSSNDTGTGNFDKRIRSQADAQVRIVYHYIPTSCLAPGDYVVKETTQPSGFNDGQETDDNVTAIPNTIGTDEIHVTLTSDTDSLNNNFGELAPSSLAGYVFHDVNANGVKDLTDPAIPSVTVTLSGVDFLGNSVSAVALTDADGAYQFTNLAPGDYTITETQPADFIDSNDLVGTQGGIAPGNDTITQIALGAGVDGAHNDFAEVKIASLSGHVYHDVNDNGVLEPGEEGLGGATLVLTGTDDLGHAVSLSTTSAGDGTYEFADLRPGTYTVSETAFPPGFDDGKDAAGNLGGTVANNAISAIPLPSGGAAVDYDFGHIVQFSSVSGFVYFDHNDNGLKNSNDDGIGDVVVTLTGVDDLGDAVSLQLVTQADGSYNFDHLRAGTYTISEAQPTGFDDGKDTVGNLGGTAANDQLFLSIGSGQHGTNYNFGELAHVPLVPNSPPPTPIPPKAPPPIPVPPTGGISKELLTGDSWRFWTLS